MSGDRLNHSFTGIAGAYTENLTETSGPLPEKLVCGRTSPGFFSVLGVLPLEGRGFATEEERFGGPNTAMIAESLWRRRFGADPDISGKSLRLNGASYPIVGVLPASFRFPLSNERVDVWIPAALPDAVLRNRGNNFYLGVGRLKPGVRPASAEADLKAAQAQLAREYPATDAGWTPLARPLKTSTVESSRQGLWMLFAAVGVVLLMGCANVACLVLAQAHRRTRELAIRFSLGAQRRQVVRQLLWESFLLALPGSLLGLLIAVWGVDALRAATGDLVPRAEGIRLNWQVAAFTLSLSVLTAVLVGFLPALAATRDESLAVLRPRAQVGGGQRLLRALAGLQVALAMVLLIGAGLLIRSLASLAAVPLGFDTHDVLTLRISASWNELANYAGVQRRVRQTLQAMETIPGVRSAAAVLNLPGSSGGDNRVLHIASGRRRDTEQKLVAHAPLVSASYFATLGISLIAGETCHDDFGSNAPHEAMVNRQFAERFFPGESAIGQTVKIGEESNVNPVVITGVTADARDTSRTDAPQPTLYWCSVPGLPDPLYLIKPQGSPMAMAQSLRQRLKQIEPGRAVYDIATLDAQISASMGERRLQTLLLSSFGLIALLLASVGLYGVLSFYVSQRVGEIGLRIALGARPSDVFRQVFRQGAAVGGAGIVAGLAAGAALTRLVASLLFHVSRWDPVTFLGGPAVLFAVAALATWIPARRATRVEPMEALRQE